MSRLPSSTLPFSIHYSACLPAFSCLLQWEWFSSGWTVLWSLTDRGGWERWECSCLCLQWRTDCFDCMQCPPSILLLCLPAVDGGGMAFCLEHILPPAVYLKGACFWERGHVPCCWNGWNRSALFLVPTLPVRMPHATLPSSSCHTCLLLHLFLYSSYSGCQCLPSLPSLYLWIVTFLLPSIHAFCTHV
jgi:hypothetical protein